MFWDLPIWEDLALAHIINIWNKTLSSALPVLSLQQNMQLQEVKPLFLACKALNDGF